MSHSHSLTRRWTSSPLAELVLVCVAACALTVLGGGQQAAADTYFQPNTWNGYRIFMSKACHDASDGTPGVRASPTLDARD